jgi:hypothetical protein
VKALAEKVASQLAGRVGGPSFTAMYERLCDVPKRGSGDEVVKFVEALPKDPQYEKGPEKVLSRLLEEAEGLLAKVNKTANAELQKAFKALSVDMTASLKAWRIGYTEGALDLKKMHRAVGELAFGLQKYKEAVDHVLMKDQYKSDDKVRDVRERYHRVFDGFAWKIREEVALCKDIS